MDPSGVLCRQIPEALVSALPKTAPLAAVQRVVEKHIGSDTLSEQNVTRVECPKDGLQDRTENNYGKETSAFEQLKDCDASSSHHSTPCNSKSSKCTTDIEDYIRLIISKAVEDGNNSVISLSDEEKENPNTFKKESESICVSEVFSFSDFSDKKTEGIKADKEQAVLSNAGNLSTHKMRDELLDKSSEEHTSSAVSENYLISDFQNEGVDSLGESSSQMVAISKTVKHKKIENGLSSTKKKESTLNSLKPKLGLDPQCRLRPELASILGQNILTRKQAFKALWNYVRKSCYVFPGISKKVKCDKTLSKILKKEETSYANLRYMILKSRKYMYEMKS